MPPEIILPKSATIPESHTVIKLGRKMYNVAAETANDYCVVSAFPCADGTNRALFQWWDKRSCEVVERESK